MKSAILTLLVLLLPGFLSAAELSGEDILDRIDRNLVAENRLATSTMVIKGRRGTRTMTSRSWVQGVEKSFTEYLSPPREKGTKMLKLGDELWIYSPSTDRTIKIAGHMLRRSMMGSDVSYEDFMEDPELAKSYKAEVVGSEDISGRPCYIVKLEATREDLAYHMRMLWVDKKRFVPLREELFAKSGTLLKRLSIEEIEYLDGRWYPKRMIFKDMLQKGDGTEFILNEVLFNVDIPDHIFSKASLRR